MQIILANDLSALKHRSYIERLGRCGMWKLGTLCQLATNEYAPSRASVSGDLDQDSPLRASSCAPLLSSANLADCSVMVTDWASIASDYAVIFRDWAATNSVSSVTLRISASWSSIIQSRTPGKQQGNRKCRLILHADVGYVRGERNPGAVILESA